MWSNIWKIKGGFNFGYIVWFTVDYLVIRPIQGFKCDMSQCYTKYWRKRSALDVGHRGAGSTHAAK